ncbi:simple sugar transport system permease protein [Ruminococcaceae bacterium YRB3002]|nr:simple sugar transport system permease protein [Ruminococcaceae bacterium YRB3002]
MTKLHLVRRTGNTLLRRIICYLAAIAISMGIGAILLLSLGINPLDYYSDMLTVGLIGNKYAYKSVEGFLKVFVPLLMVSMALALSFKMRFWNIGGEGEFLIGAMCAAAIAYRCDGMPGPVVLILMCLAAMISSGLVGLAVAFLKCRFNTNETLVTLMMNYIVLYAVKYIGETKAPWNFFLREDSERPLFAKFPDNAIMPGIMIGRFNLLYSVVISVILTVIIYIYLKYTKQGYEIAVVGDSINTARYAGMKVNGIILRTMFISAALIGLAGAFSASASATVSPSMTNNAGWTGIVVAWLSKLSIPGILVAAFLISLLQYGCLAASLSYPEIDQNFADLMQGMILFAVLMSDFLVTFKIVRRKETES